MAAPAQGCRKRLTPCSPPAPRGQRAQGVSSGKVMIVAHTHVGPEIKFFPLRSPNRFWPETCQVDGKVCVDGKFS